ncbi:MAG TPA: glycogen/starch/alpha-glucan phosphorylase, partial [Thermodesulfobacteriota bacterium]|nr:glycogen/starch/alpha-glucan phosphorylase [Thermodesulfobacteriota bacterium]
IYERNPYLKRVLDSFESDIFCGEERGLFKWIYEALLMNGDVYFHIADFESYMEMQQTVGQEFMRTGDWARKAILNVARIGKFSSDRTISEYAEDIWKVRSLKD